MKTLYRDCLIDSDVLFNSRVKIYPNDILKYTVFNKFIFNPDKAELINKINKRDNYTKSDNPITRDDSLKRAKDKIFDIAFINGDLWQYFITLTLDKTKIDRYDKKEINRKLIKWLNNMVSRYDFNCLLIPEYHKDGAIHFHGLCSGYNLKLTYVKLDNKGRKVYNLDNWNLGFSTAIELDDNRTAVSAYITKYVTKDTTKILGNIYYARGRNLKRECQSVYQNIDYSEFKGQEIRIPNISVKVKYAIVGYLPKGGVQK